MTSSLTQDTQENKVSPMMVQWHACKKFAKNAVLFFRMGDFYEAFYDDAILLSKELDLTLTLRPAEFLTSMRFKEKHSRLFDQIRHNYNYLLNTHEDWHFEHQIACDFLLSHLGVHTLDGFGLKGMLAGINAAGALLNYLQD